MLKKIFIVKLILFIAALTLLSQTIMENQIPPDIKTILAAKKIIFALTENDQPPFYFVNKKGMLDGLDIFIAKEIARRLNVEAVFLRKAKSFDEVVALVAEGKADLGVSKLSRTLNRARYIKYSNPYIVFHQALLINRLQLAKYTNEENIKKFIRDFKGKIGVIVNSSYVNYAKTNFPSAEIIEYPAWDDIINAVEKGEILAAYRDELEIKKIFESNSDEFLKLKPVIFNDLTDPIAIAVKYDRIQLLSWLNIFLDSINLELTAEKIIDMYKDR